MRFLKDNRGIESTEVALIIAVVVLVSYGAYKLLGENIAAKAGSLGAGTPGGGKGMPWTAPGGDCGTAEGGKGCSGAGVGGWGDGVAGVAAGAFSLSLLRATIVSGVSSPVASN